MLREADKDQDGLLLENEWLAVELWFQYRTFQPGSNEDLEGEFALERQAAKKEAYDRWMVFCNAPSTSQGTPAIDNCWFGINRKVIPEPKCSGVPWWRVHAIGLGRPVHQIFGAMVP
eukprot:scaffold120855_cov19-Tisochrysis_lutea.AAC.1